MNLLSLLILWIATHFLNIAFYNLFYTYFYCLYLCGTTCFVPLHSFYWFGLVWHWHLRFCASGALFIGLLGIRDLLATADITCWEYQWKQSSKKLPPIHISNIRNTLHSKNSKYTICDTDYGRDVSFCMGVWKEITENKTMR